MRKAPGRQLKHLVSFDYILLHCLATQKIFALTYLILIPMAKRFVVFFKVILSHPFPPSWICWEERCVCAHTIWGCFGTCCISAFVNNHFTNDCRLSSNCLWIVQTASQVMTDSICWSDCVITTCVYHGSPFFLVFIFPLSFWSAWIQTMTLCVCC